MWKWSLWRWNGNGRARNDGFFERLYLATGREYEDSATLGR